MAKMRKSAPKRKMTERDYLIEQCLMDAYCERTGEQLDEGWWDNLKAGAAGAWAGAKQGLKNLGSKASNAAKMTGNWFGRKKDQISNAYKNLGALANNQEGKKGVDPRSVTQGITDPASRISAGDAKKWAQIQSYAKSVGDTLASYIEISNKLFPGITDDLDEAWQAVLKELSDIPTISLEEAMQMKKNFMAQKQPQQPQQQGIQNDENMDQGDAPSQLGNDATQVENEEQVNSSYDPRLNSRGQRHMLDLLK